MIPICTALKHSNSHGEGHGEGRDWFRAFLWGEEFENQKAVLVFFVLLAMAFYLDKLCLGQHAPIRIHDSFESEFGQYVAKGQLLITHGFYAWFPNLAGGMPAYAYQFPPYYPLCILCALIPSWAVNSMMVILLMGIAGYGMYLFSRRFMSLPHWVALFGGTLFAFASSGILVHQVFMQAFPLFFVYSVGLMTEGDRFRGYWKPLCILIALSALSYASLTLVVFSTFQVLLIVLTNFHNRRTMWRMMVCSFLIWTGYALLNLPTIYALLEFSQYSQRWGNYERSWAYFAKGYEALGASLSTFGGLLYQKLVGTTPFFLGCLPLILWSTRARRYLALYFICAVIFSFFYSPFLTLLPKLFWQADLQHYQNVFPFCATILACVFLYETFGKPINTRRFLLLMLSLATGFILILYHAPLSSPEAPKWVLVTGLVCVTLICFGVTSRAYQGYDSLIGLSRPGRKLAVVLGLVVLCTGIMFRWYRFSQNEHNEYPSYFGNHSGLISLLPSDEGSVFRVGEFLLPAMFHAYGFETVGGRSPIFSSRYKELVKRIVWEQLRLANKADFFDAYWYNLYLRNNEEYDQVNLPLLKMLNVRFLISYYEMPQLEGVGLERILIPDDGHLHIVWSGPMPRIRWTRSRHFLYVYELKDHFPRGFLVKDMVLLPSKEMLLESLMVQSTEDLRRKVLVNETDLPPNIPRDFSSSIRCEGQGEVHMVSYEPDSIEFRADIACPQILVISNNYHAKWRATVDGREVPVFPANHAFQAVFLDEAGSHKVVLSYRDAWLWVLHMGIPFGLILMAIGVALGYRCRAQE